jgi:hypothetical protein
MTRGSQHWAVNAAHETTRPFLFCCLKEKKWQDADQVADELQALISEGNAK